MPGRTSPFQPEAFPLQAERGTASLQPGAGSMCMRAGKPLVSTKEETWKMTSMSRAAAGLAAELRHNLLFESQFVAMRRDSNP
jgi:hypothetical protein